MRNVIKNETWFHHTRTPSHFGLLGMSLTYYTPSIPAFTLRPSNVLFLFFEVGHRA